MKIADIGGRLLKLRPVDSEAKIERLEQEVERLEKQLALERREAELKAKLKELKSERRQVRPVRTSRLIIIIGAALVLLLFIAKIVGC